MFVSIYVTEWKASIVEYDLNTYLTYRNHLMHLSNNYLYRSIIIIYLYRKNLTILFQKKSREKALTRHNTIVRLLIRRYVTAEQRKRDEFGITEDDVREIRQDISSFRYDLIDILRKNGMCTPALDKEETNSQYIYT